MLRRVLRLARMLCALMYRQNGDSANLLKSAREKCAPECPFECGRGGAIAIWAVPKCLRVNLFGASLNVVYFSFSEDITGQFELFGRWAYWERRRCLMCSYSSYSGASLDFSAARTCNMVKNGA